MLTDLQDLHTSTLVQTEHEKKIDNIFLNMLSTIFKQLMYLRFQKVLFRFLRLLIPASHNARFDQQLPTFAKF